MTNGYQEEKDGSVDWEDVATTNPRYYRAFDLLGEVIAEEVEGEIMPPQLQGGVS